MLFKNLIFVFALVVSNLVFAVNDDVVRILRTSSTKQTFEVNEGLNQGVTVGEYGFLIQSEVLSIGKTILRPILKAKCIRAFSNKSVWIRFLSYEKKDLSKGQNYILLTESGLLKGRKKLSSRRLDWIVESPEDVNKFLKDDAQELAKKKDKYKVLSTPHKIEKHYDTDLELVDVNVWKAKMGDSKLYADGIYKSPHADDFAKRVKVQTFEKMVVAYLNKFNDVNFSYEEYFQKQKETSQGKGTNFFGNYYERYNEKELSEYKKSQLYYEKVKKNGDSWSKDYNDQQLSELLNRMSDVKERMRRQDILAFHYNHNIAISFGMNMIDNENRTDVVTTETSKVSGEVLYERYLFKGLGILQGFTFGVSGRYAKDAFFGGDLNLSSTEYSFAGHLNYYPYRKPSSINHPIFFVGLLFRYGYSRLRNASTDEQGNYYIKTLPGVRAGLKWNVESGYGAFISFGYENINAERVVVSDSEGVLPDRDSYVDGRLNIGISKFF